MQPRRISILGVGLLGGSVGLAVRQRISGCHVVGYAHRPSTLTEALQRGAIHEGHADPALAVRGADLVLLCSPVGVFEPLLRSVGQVLSAGALVSDVGSTKRSVVEAARRLLPAGARFVGSHPMAGSEKRGVRFARADLFDGALCLVTPTEGTGAGAVERIEAFWKSLGMRTARLTPDEHDRRLADVSHLPHAVAAALVAMQEGPSLPLAGKGFLDATRIAAGDAALWRDIFLDNRDNLRQSLARFRGKLDELAALLLDASPENAERLKEWLESAAAGRVKMEERGKRIEDGG